MENYNIGFVGGGAMAEALLSGILQKKLVKCSSIFVSEIVAERRQYLSDKYNINVYETAQDLVAKVNILFLTVKPQVVANVLSELQPIVKKDTLIVSVVAGLKIDKIEVVFKENAVVRVMPNTPVAVGEGMTALALGTNAQATDGEIAQKIFNAVGKTVLLGESSMDAVTGLSGSGPGYAFVIIDALADAGVKVGLTRKDAITLAAQTLLGSAKMVLETGEHPAKLRDMVTSPAGTTIAGIHVLEQAGLRAALIDAVEVATLRSKNMGEK